jgi:hypothetical protein
MSQLSAWLRPDCRSVTVAVRNVLLAFALAFSAGAFAQQRVDPHFTHYRVYCVVPLVGTGTAADPVRPDYVPLPPDPSTSGTAASKQATGIIAFYHEVSDDGKWALAEIVSLDRASLQPILSDTRPGVWAGMKGVVSRAEVQAVFHKYKQQAINLDAFGVAVR